MAQTHNDLVIDQSIGLRLKTMALEKALVEHGLEHREPALSIARRELQAAYSGLQSLIGVQLGALGTPKDGG